MHAASVAELAWVGPDGRPDAIPATPLLLDGDPAVAYPYAYQDHARRLAGAPVLAVIVSEPRMSGTGWNAVAALGRGRLTEDRDGALFKQELLVQELRKYPPSRAMADSPLLQREHWWYIPRMIVRLEVAAVVPLVARSTADEQVLAVNTPGEGLTVDTVRIDQVGAGSLGVTSLSGRKVPDGSVALLGHDFSEPDLERWTPWVTRGELADRVVTVTERPERTTLAPTLKLRERYRRHRQLERDCRAALGD